VAVAVNAGGEKSGTADTGCAKAVLGSSSTDDGGPPRPERLRMPICDPNSRERQNPW